MALEKDILTESRAMARYWRIVHVDTDYKTNSVAFDMEGYLDKDARDAKAANLGSRRYGYFLDKGVEPTRADLYAVAKAQADFDGAVDA